MLPFWSNNLETLLNNIINAQLVLSLSLSLYGGQKQFTELYHSLMESWTAHLSTAWATVKIPPLAHHQISIRFKKRLRRGFRGMCLTGVIASAVAEAAVTEHHHLHLHHHRSTTLLYQCCHTASPSAHHCQLCYRHLLQPQPHNLHQQQLQYASCSNWHILLTIQRMHLQI